MWRQAKNQPPVPVDRVYVRGVGGLAAVAVGAKPPLPTTGPDEGLRTGAGRHAHLPRGDPGTGQGEREEAKEYGGRDDPAAGGGQATRMALRGRCPLASRGQQRASAQTDWAPPPPPPAPLPGAAGQELAQLWQWGGGGFCFMKEIPEGFR